MNAPCKDCAERHPICHDHCPKYLEYRAERNRIIRERRALNGMTWGNERKFQANRKKLNRYKRNH